MLDGSLTINSSMPFASMALRVFARRSAYSPRVNLRIGSTMSSLPSVNLLRPESAIECRASSRCACPVARQCGDGRVLNAGAGEIDDRDGIGRGSAGLGPGDDLAKFCKDGIRLHDADGNGVMQLTEPTRLFHAVRHIEIGLGDQCRLKLILVLRIRPHGRDMLTRHKPV